VNLAKARERVGGKVALQGNIDPSVLFAPPSTIRIEARAVLDSFGNHPGHVFNLGHGISQFTPPEHVAELVDEVHRHSRAIRAGSASGTSSAT
jgi:uroporphyrinogen decarboxylase